MKRLALLVAAASAAFALAGQATAATKLTGVVGPGFTITLTSGGKKVTSLKAGAYTVVVQDKASVHNFHLTGPGLNKATSVGGTGTMTWKVTLKKGTYKYVCDPHSSAMKGSFKVA
jgi:plastocyanin